MVVLRLLLKIECWSVSSCTHSHTHTHTHTYNNLRKQGRQRKQGNDKIDGLMYDHNGSQQWKALKFRSRDEKRVKKIGVKIFFFFLFIFTTYCLVGKCWKHNCFFHCVHHKFPQLLQHSLQDCLLADLSKQRQAETQKHTISQHDLFMGRVLLLNPLSVVFARLEFQYQNIFSSCCLVWRFFLQIICSFKIILNVVR